MLPGEADAGSIPAASITPIGSEHCYRGAADVVGHSADVAAEGPRPAGTSGARSSLESKERRDGLFSSSRAFGQRSAELQPARRTRAKETTAALLVGGRLGAIGSPSEGDVSAVRPLQRHCQLVARRLAEGKVIPFLGAGAACASDRPTAIGGTATCRAAPSWPRSSRTHYGYPEQGPLDLVRVSQYVELRRETRRSTRSCTRSSPVSTSRTSSIVCSRSSRRSTGLENIRRPDSS